MKQSDGFCACGATIGRFNRTGQCRNCDASDRNASAQHQTEADILILWDRGQGSRAIAANLDLRERYVLDVLSRFERHDDWQDRARESSRALIAAIAKTGGCFA